MIDLNNFTTDEVNAVGSQYFKSNQGANRLRIISNLTSGYEAWFIDEEGTPRPKRQRTPFTLAEVMEAKDQKQKVFAACVVYNYETEQAEEWCFTQQTIISAVSAYCKNTAWGNPKLYDLVLTKEGAGMKTTYSVMPNPKSDFEPIEQFSNYTDDVAAIFRGEPMYDMGVAPAANIETDSSELFNA